MDSETDQYFGKRDTVHSMVEKQVILDHLNLDKDENPLLFLQNLDRQVEQGIETKYTIETLYKVLQYFVKNEIHDRKKEFTFNYEYDFTASSPNRIKTDYDYFKHLYLMLFNNEVNQIRLDAYGEARLQLQKEFKRQVRDNPDLIKQVRLNTA
jgi:oligoribonuclease NrnB/cAMP/cGMP phosphodiesterase (DHH superfamily)